MPPPAPKSRFVPVSCHLDAAQLICHPCVGCGTHHDLMPTLALPGLPDDSPGRERSSASSQCRSVSRGGEIHKRARRPLLLLYERPDRGDHLDYPARSARALLRPSVAGSGAIRRHRPSQTPVGISAQRTVEAPATRIDGSAEAAQRQCGFLIAARSYRFDQRSAATPGHGRPA